MKSCRSRFRPCASHQGTRPRCRRSSGGSRLPRWFLLRSGSACRFRQFGNESQRNAQLVELVMRAKECDRIVGAGLAREHKIERDTSREEVCQLVYITVITVRLNTKQKQQKTNTKRQ